MSQEITTTAQTLPEQIRNGHRPSVGDIYLYPSRGSEELIRLSEKEVRQVGDETYVRYNTEQWSFLDKKWVKRSDVYSVSEHELTEEKYYKLLLAPFEEIIDSVEKMSRGEMPGESVNEATTEELVAVGANLPNLLSSAQMLEDKMEAMSVAFRARMQEQMKLMEKRMEPLKAMVEQTKKQLLNIHRAISIVEIYQGVDVEVVNLCEGTPAGADIPVTVRQRILFMDEECAVIDNEGWGLDYWTRDRFYEWIKIPAHRDIILPEQKCVVVMKPRRHDKQYSSNFYEQAEINRWNKHSFIFIRNGENVSVIESEDLCIYGSVIPRKADYDKIQKDAEHWQSQAEKELGDINYRCIHFAMVLQGLSDRTGIFSPSGEINFLKNIGTQIVFDDESDSLIGNGRLDFDAWIKEQAKTIRRGSRIIYIRNFSYGKPMRYELQGDSHYFPKVSSPETGLYTVEAKRNGRLGFTYLPHDNWGERKRRETWLFDAETVINYDTVSAEVLQEYLEDRSQRRYYQAIIPLLRKYQLELGNEREYESLFLSALRKVLNERNITYTEESLQDALKWWKNKVIHIRPISADDDKAWRMIIGHLKSK